MLLRRKPVRTTVLFITMLVVNVVSGQTVSCHQAEYQTGNECCPMCLPGSRVRTDCTEFRSTSCLACLERTYMNKPTRLKQCFSCTNCDEASGLKTKTSCTIISDSVCEPLEGFYCVEPSDNDCDAAKRHRKCEPGQFISKKGTASSDSECSACSQGTFSDGSFTSCRPHTQCDAENLQLIKPGTASADAQCSSEAVTWRNVSLTLLFTALILSAVYVA